MFSFGHCPNFYTCTMFTSMQLKVYTSLHFTRHYTLVSAKLKLEIVPHLLHTVHKCSCTSDTGINALHKYMHKFTSICTSAQVYAQVHKYMHKYTSICTSRQVYVKVHSGTVPAFSSNYLALNALTTEQLDRCKLFNMQFTKCVQHTI